MDLTKLRYVFSPDCADDLGEAIRSKVIDFNYNLIGQYGKKNYVFSYYDENNNLIGGLAAMLKLGMYIIDWVWVDEKYRHQKIGSKLLQAAVANAKEVKAAHIMLNTTSFQALDFYTKNGFEVFGKLPITIPSGKQEYNYYLAMVL